MTADFIFLFAFHFVWTILMSTFLPRFPPHLSQRTEQRLDLRSADISWPFLPPWRSAPMKATSAVFSFLGSPAAHLLSVEDVFLSSPLPLYQYQMSPSLVNPTQVSAHVDPESKFCTFPAISSNSSFVKEAGYRRPPDLWKK